MSPSILDHLGPLDWQQLTVEPANGEDGVCDCCGTTTRRVGGFVSCRGKAVAAYFVGWTLDKPDHGAAFDLIVGAWGETTGPSDRSAVFLGYRVVDGSGAFMVVARPGSPVAMSELSGSVLGREQVIGTPLAHQVFAVADAVFMKDPRVAPLREWS